jgi:PAS domain S-box-containing protein
MYAPDGRVIGVLGIAHDVTEAREQARALRRADETRLQLMNASHDGILIFGEDFRVIEGNPRMAEMLGRAPEELVGMRPWQMDASTRSRGRQCRPRWRRACCERRERPVRDAPSPQGRDRLRRRGERQRR